MADPTHKQEAIDWLIRQRNPAFADWAGFTAWLEADGANASAYEQLSLVDSELADRLSASRAADDAQDQAPSTAAPGWSRRWMVGALAASVAALAAVFLVPTNQPSPSYYAVATPPGVRQMIVLAGGTTVSLNGDTRVLLDRSDSKFARLVHGEANFDMVGDGSGQFRLEVGTARLVDIGTSFNVLKTELSTEVQVADGAVEYRSGGSTVRIDAGEQLRIYPDQLLKANIDRAEVASWRQGRLVFEAEPLAAVADELSRNSGKRVTVDQRIATRPVTAVIQMPSRTEDLAPQLERLLRVKVRQDQNDWMLMSAD